MLLAQSEFEVKLGPILEFHLLVLPVPCEAKQSRQKPKSKVMIGR